MNPAAPPFVMPKFSRTMWVSDRARAAWEGKITAFAESWRQIEWLTVVDKARPCASFWLSQEELAALARVLAGHGLMALPLSQHIQKDRTLLCRAAIGSPKNVRHFHKAWERGDDDAIGDLLGYPACCRAFFRNVFVERGLTNVIWPMAAQTSPRAAEDGLVEVSGPPELNPFWHHTGVRLTPHHPCRFDCGESAALAKAFCDTGRKHGHGTSIDIALEILRWPVEWSSLHGIAEIRTPILKTTANTDATNVKRVVRMAGTSFPSEGARGLSFALKPVTSRNAINRAEGNLKMVRGAGFEPTTPTVSR